MEYFLKPTKFCDCDNQKIIAKATTLTQNDKTPKEAALSIFYPKINILNAKLNANYSFPNTSKNLIYINSTVLSLFLNGIK